ncbi:MAG: hypothetical protein ACI8Y4_005542 [Candidatus Poriferisodalaceae bacterium]|jgi:hypothetical protein
MPQNAQADESTDVDDLPQQVIDALPEDIRQEIIDGVREQIPEDVVADLRPDIADQIPDSLVGAATMSPGLTAVIVVIGVLAVAGALWGAVKGFLKVAIGLGIIAAFVWFYFFSGR